MTEHQRHDTHVAMVDGVAMTNDPTDASVAELVAAAARLVNPILGAFHPFVCVVALANYAGMFAGWAVDAREISTGGRDAQDVAKYRDLLAGTFDAIAQGIREGNGPRIMTTEEQ